MAEEKVWYYGVVYFDSGEACVSAPFESEQKCVEAMKEGIKKHPHRVVATTYMTRKGTEIIPLRKLFGSPKSRDLMQDKRFLVDLLGGVN